MMDRKPPGYHEDVALFREALSYTQSATGFSARLVEKDYFGSLILGDLLAVTSPPWVFKGGTCLSKVHSDFYRLSEDLDFAYSVPVDVPRSQRRMRIEPVKKHLATLAQRLACFQVASPQSLRASPATESGRLQPVVRGSLDTRAHGNNRFRPTGGSSE